MKKILILAMYMAFSIMSNAQYVSSISYPDIKKGIIQDTSLLSVKYANTITAEELSTHLRILASDEFEGRETGQRGNELAAEYIAMQFRSLDLPTVGTSDSYFQDVYFNKTYWSKNELKVNGNDYKHLWDYLSYATVNSEFSKLEAEEVVFLGYGIDDPNYSDYKGKNVAGKVIMINKGEPLNKDSVSYVTGTKEMSDWSKSVWNKLELAESKGVKMVLIIEDKLSDFLNNNRKFMVSPSLRLGDGKTEKSKFASHLYISTTIAKDIIGEKGNKVKRWRKKNRKRGKSKNLTLPVQINGVFDKTIDVIDGYNVLGFIEGTDKKDEIVVVSAHYDHLGKRGNDVYNGADDNGSGTCTVLEIAEALSIAKNNGEGPRRSVLCLLVTGEEKGLLGSQYYSENPVFPLDKTIADVNIDMVGRTDKTYEDQPNYIYVIGSDRLSSDLHEMNERINQDYSQLILDYKYNDVKDPNRYYFRSDHYNFAKNGIPSIFFFSGVHEDYHRITDTVDKIMFPKMEKLGRHVFHLVWELANQEDKIRVTVENEKKG